jgi:hypothetical protein
VATHGLRPGVADPGQYTSTATLTSERRYNPLRASDRHRPERML